MEFSSGTTAETELFKRLLRIFPESLTHLGPKFVKGREEKEVSDVLIILGNTLISFQCKWKELEATTLDATKYDRVERTLTKGVTQHKALLGVLDKSLPILDKSSSKNIQPWNREFDSVHLVTVLALNDSEYSDPGRRFCTSRKIEHRKSDVVHCLLLKDIPDLLEYLTTPADFIWYLKFRIDAKNNSLGFKNELDALMMFKIDLHRLPKKSKAEVKVGYYEESRDNFNQSEYIEFSKLYDTTVQHLENHGLLAEVEITDQTDLIQNETVSLFILGLLSLANRGERYYFSESLRPKLKSLDQVGGSFVLTCNQGGFLIGVNASSGYEHHITINGTIMLCCVGMKKTGVTKAIGLNLRFEGKRMFFDGFYMEKEKILHFDELAQEDLLAEAEELRTYHQSLDSHFRKNFKR